MLSKRDNQPLFFNMLSFTSTNLSASERDRVKKLIEAHGGKYTPGFNSKITGTLLVPEDKTESAKFTAAVQHNKLTLMPSWVDDSVRDGYARLTEPYKVNPPIWASTPTQGVPAPTSFAPEDTISSDISCIPAQVDNVDETIRSIEFSLLDISRPKRPNRHLKDVKVFFSGFLQTDKDKFKELLALSSATTMDELNDQVSHVVVGSPVTSDLAAINSKGLTPFVVTHLWIIECFQQKQRADETPFLYQQPPSSKEVKFNSLFTDHLIFLTIWKKFSPGGEILEGVKISRGQTKKFVIHTFHTILRQKNCLVFFSINFQSPKTRNVDSVRSHLFVVPLIHASAI